MESKAAPKAGEAEKGLAEILGAISKLTSGMEKLMDRVGALEARSDGGRRVTMARGGGKSEGNSDAIDPEGGGAEAGEFQDGHSFFERNQEFSPGMRPSISSSLSSVVNQDAGTKLERPKFVVKLSKTIEGVKKELIRDSDFLDYFDQYQKILKCQ